ncbi:MAG TPA: bile acid:sodium symporter [Candidatus Woesebacteria bacterium]|nr:bile acid:sodium symporter [Candidatus Woesebacteria bacterium]
MDQFTTKVKNSTWLIVLSAIVISFILPEIGIFVKPYLNALLSIMMFLSCLDLQINQIIKSFSDYKTQIIVLAITHLISPLIIFLLKDYFSPQIYLGLILAASIPSGRSAVFLANIYGGNPIKALVTSSLSNAISPIIVPLFVWLFAHTVIQVNPAQMSQTLIWMVIVPLLFALPLGKTYPGRQLNRLSPALSTFILFFIILGIISPVKTIIIAHPLLTIGLTFFASLLTIINFYFGFKLKTQKVDQLTYGITASVKNYTLATLLSLSVFEPIVALPSIAYTIANNLLLIPLQLFLKPKSSTTHPHHHRNQNYLLLFLGIILAIYLAQNQAFIHLLTQNPKLSFLAAIIGGMLFTSTFTVSIGGLIIAKLVTQLNFILLIFLAGLGALLADYLIFRFFKNKVTDEITPIFSKINHHSHLWKLFHTKYFGWTMPVIGTFVLASPLPDELGVSLLGISKISTLEFVTISYLSHSLGIATLIAATLML